MGQVAFDTQEFVETLENAGLPKDQAKAISIAVRKSHEVADVATKRDLEDVRKDLKAVIQNHDAQLPICFEKTESKIMDMRKDFTIQLTDIRRDMDARFEKHEAQMQARFEKHEAQMQARFQKTEAQMQARFEKTEAQISLVRKDLQLEMAGIRAEQKLIRWMLSAGILGILSLVVKAFLVTAL